MRCWLVACSALFGLVGCGGQPAGSGDDDGPGGGTIDPTIDAPTGASDASDPSDPSGDVDAETPTEPEVVAQDTTGISIMRTDATHLYWVQTRAPVMIRRMPLGGGTIETLYTGTGYAMGLAVQDGFAYVAEAHDLSEGGVGLIVRVPVTGGAPETLATPIGVRMLDVEDGWVYYGDTPDFPPRVMKVAITGGTPHFIVRSRASSVPFEVRAADGALYYTDAYAITRVDVQTKRLTTLADNLVPTQITIDDGFVYFIACSSGVCTDATAYRVPRAGGAYEALGSGDSSASRIAVLGDTLQWGTHVLPTTGGPARTLLATSQPAAVAITANAFYIGDMQTGTIYRITR